MASRPQNKSAHWAFMAYIQQQNIFKKSLGGVFVCDSMCAFISRMITCPRDFRVCLCRWFIANAAWGSKKEEKRNDGEEDKEERGSRNRTWDNDRLFYEHPLLFKILIFTPNSSLAFFTLLLHLLDWKEKTLEQCQRPKGFQGPNVHLLSTSLMTSEKFQQPFSLFIIL